MALEFAGAATPLGPNDIDEVAKLLGVESAAIHAVKDIESSGHGFLPDGRPVILFESHVFHTETRGEFDERFPDISTSSWVRNYGAGGAHQYERLDTALGLSRANALQSASWGMFQLLGTNFAACGFHDVESFVMAMTESERSQLDAFAVFLKTNHLDRELAQRNWATFARGYNGAGYRENGYDTKLAQAYLKWRNSATNAQDNPPRTDPDGFHAVLFDGMLGPNDEVKVVQGFLGLRADGWFGPNTRVHVMTVQRQHGLDPDGIVGPATRPFVGLT